MPPHAQHAISSNFVCATRKKMMLRKSYSKNSIYITNKKIVSQRIEHLLHTHEIVRQGNFKNKENACQFTFIPTIFTLKPKNRKSRPLLHKNMKHFIIFASI